MPKYTITNKYFYVKIQIPNIPTSYNCDGFIILADHLPNVCIIHTILFFIPFTIINDSILNHVGIFFEKVVFLKEIWANQMNEKYKNWGFYSSHICVVLAEKK